MCSQSNGTTDTEKQLHVLEAENDALKAQLRDQEKENTSLAQQIAHVAELEAKIEVSVLSLQNRLDKSQMVMMLPQYDDEKVWQSCMLIV